jgi:hypothetical protein
MPGKHGSPERVLFGIVRIFGYRLPKQNPVESVE